MIFLSAVSPHARESLTRSDRAELKAGGVLVDVSRGSFGSGAHVRGVIDVPVSTKVVWRVLVDCERAPKFLSGLQSCRILKTSHDGRWDLREHRVRWSWFLPEFQCIVRSDYIRNHVISFERTGGDLRSLKGTWIFQGLRGGKSTRLFYDLRIDLGWSLPGSLTQSVLLQDVPVVLRALRREAIRVEAER